MAFKLLAVLAFAGGVAHAETPRLLPDGRPAAGNTMGKNPGPEIDPATGLTPEETVAVEQLRDSLATLLGMTSPAEPAVQPRQIAGRPACGNVASRAPRRQDCP